MNINKPTIRIDSFRKEVLKGLTDYPKHLSSKYIYDKTGDRLFQDIMAMPGYYLTRCEMEIIFTYKKEIGELFRDRENGLDLIELGAGDGTKTKVLLKYMAENRFNFTYKPIDISENAVSSLTNSLAEQMPSLHVKPVVGEYLESLERMKKYDKRKKVIMMLGSNIGNMLHPEALDFLRNLRDIMREEDLLFIGMDQKKILKPFLQLITIPKASPQPLIKIFWSGSIMRWEGILILKNSGIGRLIIPKPEQRKVF